MADTDERVADAVENAADAQIAADLAIAEQAEAELARTNTTTAAVAVEAARTGAALAEANAAKTIQTSEEERLKWQNNLESLANSQANMAAQITALEQAVPSLINQSQEALMARLEERLTPPAPTEQPTPSANPDAQDAHQEAKIEETTVRHKKKAAWF